LSNTFESTKRRKADEGEREDEGGAGGIDCNGEAAKNNLRKELKKELEEELRDELKSELKAVLKDELKAELKTELKTELRSELKSKEVEQASSER